MSEMRRLDQYLKQRKGRWYYVCRVPLRSRDVDTRDVIKLALMTGSREVARARRDSLAEADEQLWASLATYDAPTKSSASHRRYRAAKSRAFARVLSILLSKNSPRTRLTWLSSWFASRPCNIVSASLKRSRRPKR